MAEPKRSFLENGAITLPTLSGLFMMFIGAGFTLVSFIYTSGQSEINSKLEKAVQNIDESNKANNEIQKAMILQNSRLDRHGEQISDNTKRIETLEQRQQDLEKAAILSNANRR